jgi:hypothetical protein
VVHLKVNLPGGNAKGCGGSFIAPDVVSCFDQINLLDHLHDLQLY